MSQIYFDPKFLENLRRNTQMSPETAHKIFHPYCGICLAELGRNMAQQLNPGVTSRSTDVNPDAE